MLGKTPNSTGVSGGDRFDGFYNAHIVIVKMKPFPSPVCCRAVGALIVVLLALNHANASTNWAEPEQQIAARIVAVTGPGTMAVEFENRASLGRTDAEEIRRGILAQLSARGARFVDADQAAAVVRITLSEDLQNYVWVAEVRQGPSESPAIIVSMPRGEAAFAEGEAAPITIHKSLLWAQAERILDGAVIDGNPARMIVLDWNAVTIYGLQNNGWQAEQTLPIAHSHAWPRDLHGRLILRKDHLFDAYLPGVYCRSSSNAPLTMTCYASDDPWPLTSDGAGLSAFYAAPRNFFTGALAPGIGKQTSAPAFYSAAALPREKYTLWLLATADGQPHLLDGITDQSLGRLGWGSEIASVRSGCGAGWQVLASGKQDEVKEAKDTLQAFEFPDRDPVAVSQTAEFHGVITALWTDSLGTSAVAVVRDQQMGRYEAFRITITCSR